MGALFSVKFNPAPLEQFRRQLGGKVDNACARSLNRSIKAERTFLKRAISGDLGLAAGVVDKAMSVREAKASDLKAQLVAKGARIPLIEFKARGPEPSRGRGRGVSYRLPGSVGRMAHAFIATMKSGHRGVFVRAGDSRRHGPRPNRSQLPIRELFGPSIVRVFTKFAGQGDQRRIDTLLTNLRHEIEFALKRSA